MNHQPKEVQIISKKYKIYLVLLILILELAFSVRIWKIDYDLPFIYHPDEPIFYLSVAHYLYSNNFQNLSLEALPSGVPINSFVAVLNALAYYPYTYIRSMFNEATETPEIYKPDMIEMGVVKTDSPGVVLMGRTISAIVGTLSVFLVFMITLKLSGKYWTALFSTFILAITPTHVLHSRFITPDIYVTFFILLTSYLALLIGETNHIKYYIFAGMSLGFVASSKMTGILVCLVIACVIFFKFGFRGFINFKFLTLVSFSLLTLLLNTPFIFGSFRQVVDSYIFEGTHYTSGHPGMEGETVSFYFIQLFRDTSVFLLFGLAGIFHGILKKSKYDIALAIFVVVYFIFVSRFIVRNDRTILPIIPFILIFSSLFLKFLYEQLLIASTQEKNIIKPRMIVLLLIVLVGIFHIVTFELPDRMHFELSKGPVLESARLWIEDNIPKNSKIVLESYSPYLEEDDYELFGTRQMINQTSDWYREQNFRYLVFSQRMYGRFFSQPELYSNQINAYQKLFNSFVLIKIFEDPNYQIMLFRIH